MTKEEVLEAKRQTRIAILSPGDSGAGIITKVGGVPYWPKGVSRPRCSRNHQMSFVLQVRLADVPGWSGDRGLLSFHYCMFCLGDGHMSFGLNDTLNPPGHVGYKVDLMAEPGAQEPDGLGEIPTLEDYAREGYPDDIFPPMKVEFREVFEVMSAEEAVGPWGETLDLDYTEIEDLSELECVSVEHPIHVPMTKLGGWPAWDHSPEWPSCTQGHRLTFVAQLDYWKFPQSSWAGGGHAFLFACVAGCSNRHGELVIQTT